MALTKISAGAHNVDTLSVGTSDAPPKPLLVDGGADYNVVLRSASSRSGLVMHTPGTGSLGGPAASTLLLADNTFRLGTTNHYNMIMDQGGRVMLPQQPAFVARRSGDYSHTANNTIQFNATAGNRGNHFSTSTHLFTAPVTGVYFFHCTVIMNGVANGTNLHDSLRLIVNNAVVGYSNRRGTYNTTSMSAGYFVDNIQDTYFLSANDTVGVRLIHSIGVHGNSLYTRFSGFLVG